MSNAAAPRIIGLISNDRAPRKRRLGCFTGLLLFVGLGSIALVAIDLALYPWIYVVGGRVRLLPVWAGSGEMQVASGKYRIFLSFSPTSAGSRMFPSTDIAGYGWVCTPNGQRYSLRVTGGASGRIWKDMDGHSFHISAYHRPLFWRFRSDPEQRPRLGFSGKWVGPNLVMSDDGTIAHEFRADGTLKSYRESLQPTAGTLPIFIKETHWWYGAPDCQDPQG